MKILVVGYSNIAVRKVLPAIDSLDFDCIELATSEPDRVQSDKLRTPVKVYEGYENGIRQSDAEICYISTVNGAHYSQALLALEQGKHTIVDKPISSTEHHTQQLIDISREKNLLLSESVVYLDHPRVAGIIERLGQRGIDTRHISAVFCFPPLPDTNFRYNPRMGGGALMDLGAYIVTPGRLFFAEKPSSVHAVVSESRNDLPIGLRITFGYSGGRTFSGYYSFDAEYQNEIRLSGRDFFLHLERFFTTPANLKTDALFRSKNSSETWHFPAGDAFAHYMIRIMTLLRKGDYEEERDKICSDHEVLAMVRHTIMR